MNYFEFYINNKKSDGGIKVSKLKKTLKKTSSVKNKVGEESGNFSPGNDKKKLGTKFKLKRFKKSVNESWDNGGMGDSF